MTDAETTSPPAGRAGDQTAEALLDAAERLLARSGPAALTTRRIAEEAGQSHGLIRYHFGSLEQLMIRTLERATERILTRQRQLYAGAEPFLDKWRTAMAYLESDLRSEPFPKLAVEMLALGWNQPAYRDALRRLMGDFTEMLSDAVRVALTDYAIEDFDSVALVTLIRTFQLGIMVEHLAGIDLGHAQLLQAIDGWLERLPRRDPSPAVSGKVGS